MCAKYTTTEKRLRFAAKTFTKEINISFNFLRNIKSLFLSFFSEINLNSKQDFNYYLNFKTKKIIKRLKMKKKSCFEHNLH
jgi:hypothetical protein